MDYGQDDDDDDAFDENGVLKDGHSYRVPMKMLDSLQKEIHDHTAAFRKVRIIDAPLHQPGFVRTSRPVAERHAIFDGYDVRVSNAWKNPPTSRKGVSGSQAAESDRQGSGRDAKDAKQAAYAAYEAYIANAWRGAGR